MEITEPKSLKDALASRFVKKAAEPKSERAALFADLYAVYERSYKQNSWDAYKAWLRSKRLRHSPERVAQYAKDPTFRKPVTVKSFCSYWFGFLKTQDLYYVLSVARDMERRGQNVNKWLFYSIKPKKESVV